MDATFLLQSDQRDVETFVLKVRLKFCTANFIHKKEITPTLIEYNKLFYD